MIIILPLLKKKIIFSFTFHTFPRLTRQTFRSLLSLDLPAELLRGPTRSRHQINTHLPSHLCLPPPLSLYQDWPGSLLPAQIVSFVECRSLQAAQRCRTTPALSFFSTTISCCHLTPIAGFVEITWKENTDQASRRHQRRSRVIENLQEGRSPQLRRRECHVR